MANQEITPTQRTIAVCTEIEQERLRQISVEGHSPENDDKQIKGELLRAACIYGSRASWPEHANKDMPPQWPWPWFPNSWKGHPPRRMMVIAAALLAAEIERLDRIAEREAAQVEDDAGAVGNQV